MKWTKRHSANAVAAKARKRIARAQAEPEMAPGVAPKLPRFVPDFTINIRARNGDRVQITASRFQGSFITGDGIKSARQIGRGLEAILRHYSL